MHTDETTAQPRLLGFFGLTFALTWLCWIPWSLWMLGNDLRDPSQPSLMNLLNLLGVFGPGCAALIVTGATVGRDGMRALLARLRLWRVAPVWYGAALGLPALSLLAALGLHLALGGALPAPRWSLVLPQIVIALLVSLGEEIGWRGYALPALLRRTSALRASLILGLLWGLWHLPVYIAVTDRDSPLLLVNTLVYLSGFVSGAIMFTWLAKHTGGSLLLAILLHASTNALYTALVVTTNQPQLGLLNTLVGWLLAATIIGVGGIGRPTRQHRADYAPQHV